MNGPKKVYYQNGKLQEETVYKNNKREGLTKWYTDKGKTSIEYNYISGNLDGMQKTYYATDGALNTETMYKENLMNGEHKEYHEDGKTIKISGSYLNDKKNGTWKEFDKEGKLINTQVYKNDVLQK
jgi:antitoxin component YwqK of YwqJK toxin-antitoxin module